LKPGRNFGRVFLFRTSHPKEQRRSFSSGRASRGPVGRVSKDDEAPGLYERSLVNPPMAHQNHRRPRFRRSAMSATGECGHSTGVNLGRE
jgi:hypothetical protein